ncbi:arylamine N-acetyltransferase [Bacillus sp. FJAT-29790]|uniref:arylamine N-acetyltransferase family protein n=1 Tax=Bacillus sp. FJAT-29790 TaxID=1895002 RepID=UPI001C247728|nr:arylamine N-acetyltransferase [Bacillus sp. FJAT-29790]
MDIQAYLQRFSVEQESQLDLNYLTKLQKCHLEKIPFENLDVTRKVEIILNVSRFFEKIVDRHRGGYCYELNGLFHKLLTDLGFEAHLIACTVKRPNGWAKENTHAAIIVHLDQPFLVDVGFGDSVRQPLPLTGEERKDVSGTYRVKKNGEAIYHLERLEGKEWKTLYRFTVSPKELIDFTEGCLYNQISPESSFTHGDIVTLATKSGRITLNGLIVTRTEDGVKEKFELTEEEKKKYLEEHFKIVI